MRQVMDQYGVRHKDGQVTVHITGHPFVSAVDARERADEFDQGECEECGATEWKHEIVGRHRPAWRPVP